MRLRPSRTVWIGMRAVIVLVLLTATARAEVDVGVGFFGQATRYADQPNRNFGAAMELAISRAAHWQYLAEVAVAAVSFGKDFAGGVAGTQVRGAVGVRSRARRFTIHDVHFDLGFEGLVGVQDIEWSVGGRDIRPELAVGFAWSFVVRRITFRTSLRSFFTSAPTSELACRGPCMTDDAITSGYMLVTGVAW